MEEVAFAIHQTLEIIQLVKKHTNDLLAAVRGAKDKRSVWYSLCKELGDNCATIRSLLDNIADGLSQSRSTTINTESIDVALDSLDREVREGVTVVKKCHDTSAARLYFRGNSLKEEFRQVADRIARCLRNIPLAQLPSTIAIERTVCEISEQLQNARFELSEEDKARLQSIENAVKQQGRQTDAQMNAMQRTLQQIMDKLDINREEMLEQTTGDTTGVNLRAKEEILLSQIATFLQNNPPSPGGARGRVTHFGPVLFLMSSSDVQLYRVL